MRLIANAALLLICIVLAGCMLQSKVPLYGDGDGVMLLKPYGSKLLVQFLDHGEWKAEQKAVTFVAEGRHYVVTGDDPNKKAAAVFVDLGHGVAMLQFSEAGSAPTYVLAQATKDAVMLRPLMCDALKASAHKSAVVSFKDRDCFLNAKPTAGDVKAWLASLPAAKMRLKAGR